MRHTAFCLAFTAIATFFPQLVAANDVQIAQQIATQLRAQKDARQLIGFHIGVKVDAGRVWMKGQVSDTRQQHLALDIARRVPGVNMVVNELHIGPPNAQATQTTPLTPAVPVALQQPQIAQVTASHAQGTGQETVPVDWQQTNQPTTIAAPLAGSAVSNQIVNPVQANSVAAVSAAPHITVSAPSATGSGLAKTAVAHSAVPSLQVSPSSVATTNPYVHQQTALVQPPIAVQQTALGSQLRQPVAVSQLPIATQHRMVAHRPIPTQGGPPRPIARVAAMSALSQSAANGQGAPLPANVAAAGGGVQQVMYDHPTMPGYAWPSYASYPNYAALTYPKQYSPTAWPYIGPFYPYPQVPLGWRKVTLEWDDGWWFLDFTSK